MKKFKVAVAGVTGAVGQEMLKVGGEKLSSFRAPTSGFFLPLREESAFPG